MKAGLHSAARSISSLSAHIMAVALLAVLVGAVTVMGSDPMAPSDPPHIVYMVIDDVGWSDHSLHDLAADIPTPNLRALQGIAARLTSQAFDPGARSMRPPTSHPPRRCRCPAGAPLHAAGMQPDALGHHDGALPVPRRHAAHTDDRAGVDGGDSAVDAHHCRDAREHRPLRAPRRRQVAPRLRVVGKHARRPRL